MENAANEFLVFTRGLAPVKCAYVDRMTDADYEFHNVANLPVNWTVGDIAKFLSDLDFEYNDGYGLAWLRGTIWFMDGTWAERRDYDGAEWWLHCTPPIIPDDLKVVPDADKESGDNL